MTNNNYCVILAGGKGRRLWPVSRAEYPKQFIDFFGVGRTQLQQTFDRLAKIIPADHILVNTNQTYADLVREQLPELPSQNLMAEPIYRNTAPSVAWAAHRTKFFCPNANLIVVPSDHAVQNEDLFKKQVEGLTEQENNEYLSLQLARGRKRFYLLEKELQRSGVKFRNLPDKLKGIYSNFLMFFECQHIRIYPPIVWIDFERAMHIVVRHMQGMQAKGKFESKTPIRYDYKDLINLIRIVVNKVEDQIELEFRTKPDKTFIRKNARAIEYNGNYYRLEIEANGRLLTFHPYN